MDVSNHKAMGNRSSFDETWQPMARFNLGVSTAKNGRKNLTVLKPRFLWKDAFCFSLLGGKGSEDKKDTACCNCSTGRVCRCSPSMLHMLHTSQSIALTPKTHQHSDLWFDANQEVQMLSYHRRVGWIRKIGVCAKSGNFAKGIRSEKTDFILSVYKGCGSLTPFPRVSASTAPNPPSTPTTFTFSPYISFVCNSPVSNSQPPNSCGLGLLRPSASFCVGPAKSPSGFPTNKTLESTLISEGRFSVGGCGLTRR